LHVTSATSLFSALERHVGFRRFINAWIIIIIVWIFYGLGGSACFAYGKTVINQRRVEKSTFEDQPEENFSVNNKMNDFLRNILQKKFYAYCYILLSGTPRCTPICGAAMLLRCNWCQNLAAVGCILHWIVLTLFTLHTRNSSCITLS